MFKHFRDDLHVTWFEDQLISLDLTNDSYTVFSKAQSKILEIESRKFINKEITQEPAAPLRGVANIFFKPGLFPNPDPKMPSWSTHYCGIPINCWELTPRDSLPSRHPLLIAFSAFTLHKVHKQSDKKRISGLVSLIKAEKLNTTKKDENPNTINQLVFALNFACLLYPRKTKCLEWACALILISRKYGIDMKLVIGVQNRPFFAHAWAEWNNKVIGDDANRRSQLAVIFESN